MFVVHWLWRTAMTIYGALEWYDKFSPSSATEDIISLVGTLEAGIIMGSIMLYVVPLLISTIQFVSSLALQGIACCWLQA